MVAIRVVYKGAVLCGVCALLVAAFVLAHYELPGSALVDSARESFVRATTWGTANGAPTAPMVRRFLVTGWVSDRQMCQTTALVS